MMIRPADPVKDFAYVFYGAGEFARFVGRPDIFPAPGSPELAAVVRKFIGIPGFTVLLAEDDGLLLGGIGFWIGEYLMNVGKTEMQELFWWCAVGAPPSVAMRLLRAAKKTGQEAGASIFTWHALTTSPKGVDAAYRRLGAQPIQMTFMGVA